MHALVKLIIKFHQLPTTMAYIEVKRLILKQNKQKITKEISELKTLIAEEENQKQDEVHENKNKVTTKLREEIKKVSDILKSEDVSIEEKNGVLKSIIKEIVKTGEDGRTFNIVFWNPNERE